MSEKIQESQKENSQDRQEEKLISPKLDYMFKKVFGDENNTDLLASLLAAMLGEAQDEFDEIRIVDPNFRKEREDDKIGVLDLKVKTKGGNVIDVEIQVLKYMSMIQRISFYVSSMVTEQIGSGGSYSDIKKVSSVLIANYDLFKGDPRFRHRFTLYDKEADLELTDSIEIVTIELEKLPVDCEKNALTDWITF
jgi:predicted transposase/invertase (TIGR01784 family)